MIDNLDLKTLKQETKGDIVFEQSLEYGHPKNKGQKRGKNRKRKETRLMYQATICNVCFSYPHI